PSSETCHHEDNCRLRRLARGSTPQLGRFGASSMRILCAAIVLCVGLGGAPTAWTDENCPPLTMITSVDMQIGRDGRIYVPVRINDQPKRMLIDTGGFFTEITQAA